MVDVEHLDGDASGVGQAEGVEVIVPGTLPGERVEVAVEHETRSGRLHGRVWSLKTPSDARVQSPCRKFQVCGGCDLLHASDEFELEHKRAWVAKALDLPLAKVDPVISSPRNLHYRAVAKLVFGPRGTLGSYAVRSHRVVDMHGCKVHAPVVERVAEAVRRALNDGLNADGARYLVLRAALPLEAVHVTMVLSGAGRPAEDALHEVLARHPEVAEVWRHVNATDGDAIFDPEGPTQCLHRGRAAVGKVGSAEQHLASGAFAQINPGAAERLYARVSELIDPEGRRVLDLYSGSGGIALTLAAAGAKEVLGIERTPAAVDAARIAARGLGGKVTFEAAPVEEVQDFLKARSAGPVADGGGGGFETWVVNPPRKGLAPEVLRALETLRPKTVVYVSCAPDRLARDLAALERRYEVDAITPIDMFPQTRHIETVARLRLRPSAEIVEVQAEES